MKLTDEQVAGLADVVLPDALAHPAVHGTFSLVKELATELRELRARALSSDDCDAIRFATGRIRTILNNSAASEYYSEGFADRHRHAIEVLERIVKETP